MIRPFLISFALTVLVSSLVQAQPTGSRPSPPTLRLAATTPDLPALRLELPTVTPTYITPAAGVMTSGYGMRWGRMHRGIDIAGPIGTPIMAAAAGTVEFAGWSGGGYGNVIDIRHRDGSLTRYAHLERVLVGQGSQVGQGQMIGEMGSTGRSTGPHLHFEIHLAGEGAVNPVALLLNISQ